MVGEVGERLANPMSIVLAAVDASAAARAVIGVAQEAARTMGADLRVVHIGRTETETVLAAAQQAGVSIEMLEGDPAARIAYASNRVEVAVVVVGARSHRSGRRPYGHVARAVLRAVGKPVLIVPPDVLPAAESFERVLVPLEGSAESTAGIDQYLPALTRSGAAILVLHVFSGSTLPRFLDQIGHGEQSWSTEFLARWCQYPHAELRLRSGHVPEAILAVASAEKADLIALAWSRSFLPDRAKIVREVLSRSSVPILLVPTTQ